MVMVKFRNAAGSHGNLLAMVTALLQSLTVGTFLYVIFVEVLPSEVGGWGEESGWEGEDG